MAEFLIMCVAITIFSRIVIRKFDIKGKDIISLVIGISLTGLLNFIQFLIKSILDIIL